MNVLLWTLQILLALHTIIGALWKFTNPEQTVPSLQAIPHAAWLALSVLELLCSLGLVLPFFIKNISKLAPYAALVIAAEMLLFCIMHLFSGITSENPMIYWLVVAAISGFIAYGRFILKPIQAG